ncbi:MAG TPA: PadR family transcriptional regulator, partial [Acidimicrobiales bacterium]|nr:PadR family transcriptional regulator [Acidimicrobiales bacterium]
MLELAILGLLTEQELHGYELKKRLADTLGLLASVSFGSLYPALARLEEAGAVVAVTPDTTEGGQRQGPPSRIPMTGSLGGERAAFRNSLSAEADRPPPGGEDPSPGGDTGATRARRGQRDRRQRKVYRITEAGAALFGELLAGRDFSPDDDRGFALRLAFARHLSPDARLRLLERRRAVLAQRRERAMATPTGDTYRAALAQRRVEALDGDITWLDRLVAAERARSTTAPTEGP